MKDYPKYYGKGPCAILRGSDTTGVVVELPEKAQDRLPLILAPVVYPNKESFDERINGMDTITEAIYNDYLKSFCGRVEIDINRPMVEQSIKKEVEKQKSITLKP